MPNRGGIPWRSTCFPFTWSAKIPYRVPTDADLPERLRSVLAVVYLVFNEGHLASRRCLRRNLPGPYQIQAAIATVHSDAAVAEETRWDQIVALYDQLLRHTPGPVVELNRAVAVAERDGPAAGLVCLDQIGPVDHHLHHAARADMLDRLGRCDEAIAAYDAAIARTDNAVERDFLRERRPGATPEP